MKTEAKRSGLTSSMDSLGWSLPKQPEGSVAKSRLGRSSRLLPTEGENVSEALRRLFEGEGIELILNARTKRISGKSGECVSLNPNNYSRDTGEYHVQNTNLQDNPHCDFNDAGTCGRSFGSIATQ